MKEILIGQKVRAARIKNNITLKELSKYTGLSTGYLSQFERGQTTIAIDSLSKIADCFEMELVEFFEKKQYDIYDSNVVLKSFDESPISVLGDQFIYKKLKSNIENMHLYPRLVTIMPKLEKKKIEVYSHDGEEFLYILEGVLTLSYKDQKLYLYPGDSAHYKSSDKHNWSNEGPFPVKLLCVSVNLSE